MKWGRPAQNRAKSIESDFKADLRQIAQCLAHHDKADSVSALHADRAFEALSRCGLSRRRWFDRPESETALGGVLAGTAFSMPEVIDTLMGDLPHPGFSAGALIAFFLSGTFLFLHGSYRARLPRSLATETTLEKWGRRVLLGLLMLVASIAIVYIAFSFLR